MQAASAQTPEQLDAWAVSQIEMDGILSLYYLHAAASGALDEYHVEGGTEGVPQVLLGHEAHPFEAWEPAFTFGPDNPALFCLVGSKSRLAPAEVWDAIGSHIALRRPMT